MQRHDGKRSKSPRQSAVVFVCILARDREGSVLHTRFARISFSGRNILLDYRSSITSLFARYTPIHSLDPPPFRGEFAASNNFTFPYKVSYREQVENNGRRCWHAFGFIPQVNSGEEIGPIARRFWDSITDIQYGRVEHPWSVRIS